MRLKWFILTGFLSFTCFSSLSSATVTITVVQNEDAPAIALEMSQAVEDEIFGNYFDYGHIASNSDIRFDGSLFDKKNFALKEAAFGLSDFLIVVNLHYGPSEIINAEKKTSYAELNYIIWRVVNVLNSEILEEKKIDIKEIKVTDFDPYKQARIVADLLSSESLKVIQNLKRRGEKINETD